MKYFVLDFKSNQNDFVSRYILACVGALRHATRGEHTEIIQFGRDEYMHHPDPDEFFRYIVDELRDSDIILGFTNDNMLSFLDNIAGFRDVLFDKIDNHTPFYLQFTQLWEAMNVCCGVMTRQANRYNQLLRRLHVYPTEFKVRSSEWFCGFFTQYTVRFEPSKLDSRLSTVFANEEKVWMDETSLMTFGAGNTALLRSNEGHRNMNPWDPNARLIDYEKHSPFVIRKTENHFGYLVSGMFFAVDCDFEARARSDMEANITAISNIVRDLQSNVRVTADA